MPDREKVIKGLEHCLDYYDDDPRCEECPYQATEEEKKHIDWDCHKDDLQRDVLFLLKPVAPKRDGVWLLCGACNDIINYCDKFCPNCGKAVKWDD